MDLRVGVVGVTVPAPQLVVTVRAPDIAHATLGHDAASTTVVGAAVAVTASLSAALVRGAAVAFAIHGVAVVIVTAAVRRGRGHGDALKVAEERRVLDEQRPRVAKESPVGLKDRSVQRSRKVGVEGGLGAHFGVKRWL